ncbi:MAG: dATP/dGTP diphosphohydrolase domain-containing protein [Bacteroidota bacterium]|jgi:hypothetical protein
MQYNDPKGKAGSLKAPLGLVPPYAMEQTSWVHKLGAEKYGPWNWRETGVCASTYVNAILRHLNAWRDGESLDPESGITHLAHIACSANILMDAEYCGKLQDDRNKRPTNNETEEGSLAVGELLTISEFADILKWIRGEDEELEVADCDLKEEPEIETSTCGYESTMQVTTEGEVYRILDDGEIIQAGDEYYVARDRSWNKTNITKEWGIRPVDVHNLFRRKITKCDLEEAADCDPKEESPIDDECKCGRRKIYHWLYGWICEDCEIKYPDPHP